MRCLERNKQSFAYCNPDGDPVECIDENGNKTGERIQLYTEPIDVLANISPATGIYKTEEFGGLENYDKVIVTDDLNIGITESSVLFIDKMPTYTDATTHQVIVLPPPHFGTGFIDVTFRVPVYNYVVWRISKSLNHVAIAVKKATMRSYGSEHTYK